MADAAAGAEGTAVDVAGGLGLACTPHATTSRAVANAAIAGRRAGTVILRMMRMQGSALRALRRMDVAGAGQRLGSQQPGVRLAALRHGGDHHAQRDRLVSGVEWHQGTEEGRTRHHGDFRTSQNQGMDGVRALRRRRAGHGCGLMSRLR